MREDLALAQAKAAGLPLYNIYLDWPCSNERYEDSTRTALEWLRRERGVELMAFGDLFLQDVRNYRERLLATAGIEPFFPLWGRNTRELATEMLAAACARGSCVSIRNVCRVTTRGPITRRIFSPVCRRMLIPAPRRVNSTPSVTPAPCSRRGFRFRSARRWNAMGLCLPIWCGCER